MTRVEKKLKLSDEKFKRRIGTTKSVFLTLLDILETAYVRLHPSGGKPPTKLCVEDRLLITLQYWRTYITMEHLAYEYNTVVSNIHKIIEWVEDTLIRDGTFRLPGKKTLIEESGVRS